jgi:hypothetical protein
VTPDDRIAIRDVLKLNGVLDEVRVKTPEQLDEIVLVVSPTDWMRVNERAAVRTLQERLHIKVWLVTPSPPLEGHTEPL